MWGSCAILAYANCPRDQTQNHSRQQVDVCTSRSSSLCIPMHYIVVNNCQTSPSNIFVIHWSLFHCTSLFFILFKLYTGNLGGTHAKSSPTKCRLCVWQAIPVSCISKENRMVISEMRMDSRLGNCLHHSIQLRELGSALCKIVLYDNKLQQLTSELYAEDLILLSKLILISFQRAWAPPSLSP